MAAKTFTANLGQQEDPSTQAYRNVSAIYPNLSESTGQASNNILHELQGELSPETINSIQDEAARFGILSGMPGSQFSGHRGLRNLGLTVQGTQGQGLQDFLNTLKGYSGTLTPSTGELFGRETALSGQQTQRDISGNEIGQRAHEFDLTFPEQQRQFNETLANRQSEFGSTFGEGQRQFDISEYLRNLQNNLGSYLDFLR